jgi:excisionase family DNA binding protein
MSESQPERWLKTRAAADALGVSSQTLRRMIRRGMIKVRRLPGAHPRVAADDVVRLISESTHAAKGGGA